VRNGSVMTPEGALARLLAGNQRFVAGAPAHPHQDAARRAAVAGGQSPFAAVLGCADSRLPAEIVFDRGLGDLFVVRTAGHTVGREVLASIEYAVSVLHVPLVVVLGHHACGAVQAARDLVAAGSPVPTRVRAVVDAIVPTVRHAVACRENDPDRIVELHVGETVRRLRRSLDGRGPVLVGMVYDLRTGRVRSTSDAPRKGVTAL